MLDLELTVQHLEPDALHVALNGVLDLHGAYEFDEAMRVLERECPDCLVVDLRGVDVLDSTGLARLLALRRRCRAAGRRLVLVRGSTAVHRLFAFAELDEEFEFVGEPSAVRHRPRRMSRSPRYTRQR